MKVQASKPTFTIGYNPIGQYGSNICRQDIGRKRSYRSLLRQRYWAWSFTSKLITMAKVAKRKQTSKGLRLEVVNPNAAGIDISPKEMQVCVFRQTGMVNVIAHSVFIRKICITLRNGSKPVV